VELHEYLTYDAVGLADLVARREVAPAELAAIATDRHEQTHAALGAVVEWYDDPTPAASESGPLAGVPFLRKDYGSAEAGRLLEMGSRLAKGHRAATTGIFIERLQAAGVQILGRTAVPEFVQHGSTESEAHGPTRNPYDLDASAGGSSGGSAAAVAAGVVPAAQATDCAGSIRIPAAACGLIGLKPGRRRVPWEGGGWGGIAEEFVLARTVRDVTRFLDVLGDGAYIESAGPLRIGVNTDHWAGYPEDRAVTVAVERIATLLEERGHRIGPVAQPADHDQLNATWDGLFRRWTAADIAAVATATGRRIGPEYLERPTLAALRSLDHLTVADVTTAQKIQGDITMRLERELAGIDVLLVPTLGRGRIPLGKLAGDAKSTQSEATDAEYFPYTYLFNLTGWTAMSLPAGFSGVGLPLGVQLAARPGHERTLLRLASEVEQTAPWRTTPPTIDLEAR
jgi:amidase